MPQELKNESGAIYQVWYHIQCWCESGKHAVTKRSQRPVVALRGWNHLGAFWVNACDECRNGAHRRACRYEYCVCKGY